MLSTIGGIAEVYRARKPDGVPNRPVRCGAKFHSEGLTDKCKMRFVD